MSAFTKELLLLAGVATLIIIIPVINSATLGGHGAIDLPLLSKISLSFTGDRGGLLFILRL
ncbi:hypothetical protein [Pseudoalteromonas umbrosa]|uniref:hypothetical protein n=1 Tax=Pseudoalteromonas umbrosa TaxID=3048489 RepID=UPI0024C313AA|nr:hypothetical protein [Pseudoalteromonas sp. B95]MDK1287631.1 hypothetical protein [Pseudoalteromonas sp. B95]